MLASTLAPACGSGSPPPPAGQGKGRGLVRGVGRWVTAATTGAVA